MSAIVFLDTETTGLALDDHIWEIAAIRREPDRTETEFHWFLHHDLRKVDALPETFRLDHDARWDAGKAQTSAEVCEHMADELFIDRPHVVGAVPNFDTERIARLMVANNVMPNWHYHLIDVENLAVGWLARHTRGAALADDWIIDLPWDSDRLSRALGVEPPTDERHTAMGDVRWARAIYDVVMGGAS